MVHADASHFSEGVTKEEVYDQVFEQAKALLDGERNWVCNLANTACLLWHGYQSLSYPSSEVNWAGFYVTDAKDSTQLILGPFQGQVACQRIKFGKGVCGKAAASHQSQLVADVEAFPGHIACDSSSKSEVVVPIILEGKTVGVIDIDCAVVGGFDEVDQEKLEKLADLLAKSCDW